MVTLSTCHPRHCIKRPSRCLDWLFFITWYDIPSVLKLSVGSAHIAMNAAQSADCVWKSFYSLHLQSGSEKHPPSTCLDWLLLLGDMLFPVVKLSVGSAHIAMNAGQSADSVWKSFFSLQWVWIWEAAAHCLVHTRLAKRGNRADGVTNSSIYKDSPARAGSVDLET